MTKFKIVQSPAEPELLTFDQCMVNHWYVIKASGNHEYSHLDGFIVLHTRDSSTGERVMCMIGRAGCDETDSDIILASDFDCCGAAVYKPLNSVQLTVA